MLLVLGLALILAGAGCVAIDRRAVDFFYFKVGRGLHRFLFRTTHLAKAAHWLFLACLVWVLSLAVLHWHGENAAARLAFTAASAFICALGAGSAVLHSVKLLLGRRRPRDLLEMNLYGFLPFAFDFDRNSFPSGHALTIMIVAVSLSGLWPALAPLWFAAASWLALTRALINAHFLSDVAVGAGIGLIAAREVYLNVFPQLARGWF